MAVDWMQQIHAENPYEGFPADKFAMDLQGWGQDSPIFEHVVSTYHPSRMIEVGTWKGASAIKTAELMKRYHVSEPQLICVDTWLGSVEHWLNRDDPSCFASLALKWGRPDLYNTFLANVVGAGHDDVIIPFPADAGTAAKFFVRKGMQADAIYLDSSHEYESVIADLVAYWEVLRPGGVFIGDDFDSSWPGVVRAVHEFAERLGQQVNTSFPHKYLIEKNNSPLVDPTGRPLEEFRKIYERNDWGYGSGVGSLPLNNIHYMELVRTFIARNRLSSVVDFGCGDWQFSRFIDWSGVHYTGVDVVEAVIEQNRTRFACPWIEFHTIETVAQVPEADLLLCKDVFQHLSNRTVSEYLAAFKPKFSYMLITNDEWPTQLNRDTVDGGWRPIRIDQPPFSEIAPVILSWTLTWGGWKPTTKSVSLVIGERRRPG